METVRPGALLRAEDHKLLALQTTFFKAKMLLLRAFQKAPEGTFSANSVWLIDEDLDTEQYFSYAVDPTAMWPDEIANIRSCNLKMRWPGLDCRAHICASMVRRLCVLMSPATNLPASRTMMLVT